MTTYLFDLIIVGLIDADSKGKAIEALANITVTSGETGADLYVDEVGDIAVQELSLDSPEDK